MSDPIWQEQLFEEKSLWEIYIVTRSFGSTGFNKFVRVSVVIILFFFTIINEIVFSSRVLGVDEMRSSIISWSSDGVGYASQVLGFLIAGFTIFATLGKPQLFAKLAKTKYKDKNISNLKFVFFNFIMAITHYVAFVSWCLCLRLLAIPTGPGSVSLHKLSEFFPIAKPIIVYFVFSITIYWFVNILLLLKSFVWNVYQSVLISIALETTMLEDGESDIHK